MENGGIILSPRRWLSLGLATRSYVMKVLNTILSKGVKGWRDHSSLVGGAFLLVIVVITVIDVVGRYFREPMPGAYEICQFCLIIMVFLTMAYTQSEKAHISINFLVSRLPHRAQIFIDLLNSFLGIIIIGWISWQAIFYAINSMRMGETFVTISVSLYPFKFIMAIGLSALCYQFICDMLYYCRQLGWCHFGGRHFGNRT